jgi:hypothetical protein
VQRRRRNEGASPKGEGDNYQHCDGERHVAARPESEQQQLERDYVDLAVRVTVSAISPDDPVPGNNSSRLQTPVVPS